MRLTLSAAVVTAVVLALSGCVPGDTSSPTPGPTGESGSPSPTETEAPSGPLSLPDCTSLFTAAQVTELIGEGMEHRPDAVGVGSGTASVQALIAASSPTSCSWVLPDSERGVSVALIEMDEALQTEAEATFTAEAFSGSSSGPAAVYSIEGTGDFPFTEAHALAPGIWIAVYDGFGTNATAIAQAAFDNVSAANPGRF